MANSRSALCATHTCAEVFRTSVWGCLKLASWQHCCDGAAVMWSWQQWFFCETKTPQCRARLQVSVFASTRLGAFVHLYGQRVSAQAIMMKYSLVWGNADWKIVRAKSFLITFIDFNLLGEWTGERSKWTSNRVGGGSGGQIGGIQHNPVGNAITIMFSWIDICWAPLLRRAEFLNEIWPGVSVVGALFTHFIWLQHKPETFTVCLPSPQSLAF